MTFKELRQASGMTQKEFSEYFKIPKRTVENWETEVRICNDYIIELLEYKLRNENIIR
jgi:DNA-binding transcriptional regulator YiaG